MSVDKKTTKLKVETRIKMFGGAPHKVAMDVNAFSEDKNVSGVEYYPTGAVNNVLIGVIYKVEK